MKLLDQLCLSIRNAAEFNGEIQVEPACILWSDGDGQWEDAIPILQRELPELIVLGDYAPEQRRGPAIWLRCVIADQIEELRLPEGEVPILYLPGVSRQDMRATESCPDHLKPLAELQYRGVIWSQINAKDWTILAFLMSLGIDVAKDGDTRSAMRLALAPLLEEEVSRLEGQRLGHEYFNTLLSSDFHRDLLQWLDQGDDFKAARNDNEWQAFVELCRSQLSFNPATEGILHGATHLANRDGAWRAVWERFCEAPVRYHNVPQHIRQCKVPKFDLFTDEQVAGGWPQWNDAEEENLRKGLARLADLPAHDALSSIAQLEEKHHGRRKLVWAEIGEAPLACALAHLATIAKLTSLCPATGSVDELETRYCTHGWRIDDAVMRALEQMDKPADVKVVTAAIRAAYLPWLEDSARHLQKLVDSETYPGGTHLQANDAAHAEGDCVLFVDGLRFDTGKRLAESLQAHGLKVAEHAVWTALPSVTATGKAAVSPVADKIRGEEGNVDFEPSVADTGQSLRGGYHLKKLLKQAGWTVLENAEYGDGTGMAWCEFGNIDQEGHDRGWKLAKHIDALIREVHDRISELLNAGWQSVHVVTDHGWLLLPGGLDKVDLPSALVESKWGRCAAIKSGAKTEERLYPWYWNPDQSFALAEGVRCFKKGEEYAHGGLSLQECLTLQLTVTRGGSLRPVSIEDVVWKGLRCTVVVDGDASGLVLDIRRQAGEASSSVVVNVKPLKANGTASVVVEDEEMEGLEVTIVLTDQDGSLASQAATIIGGSTHA